MTEILILYYSRSEKTAELAVMAAKGVQSAKNTTAILERVPPILELQHQDIERIKEHLKECHGLLLGSPTRFGTMASPLKYVLETTSDLWISGALSGKPAGVFTSTASLHGGQEATLLGMILPLLHHGMLITGIPYTNPALQRTLSGGSPYGASHVAGNANDKPLSLDEKQLAYDLGARVAKIAQKMHNTD